MKNVSLSVAIATVLLSTSAMADSWTLTQTITLGTTTGGAIHQSGSTGASVQALNEINAATSTSIAAGSKQTVIEENRTVLNQDAGTSNSTQARNYAKAGSLGGATAFTQEVRSENGISGQRGGGGGGNTAAFNIVIATANGGIDNVKQDVSFKPNSAKTFMLVQGDLSGDNVQAVNMVSTAEQTAAMKQVEQTVTATTGFLGSLQYGNVSSASVQAFNNADAGSNTMGVVNQSTTGTDKINLTQQSGSQGKQVINRAVAADVSDLDQTAKLSSTGTITFSQNNTGNGAVQTGNHLTASGVISDVDQGLGDSDDAITMTQSGTGIGRVQAGNFIDTSGGGSISGTATQMVIASRLSLYQSAGSSVQVANALITGGASGGGELAQSINVATLEMNQTGATGSIQAGNYAGSATQ